MVYSVYLKELLTSLMFFTISNSAVVLKLQPSFLSSRRKYLVSSRPAMSFLMIECGRAKPSKIGTECVTPSPESRITPVVRPVEQRLRTACIEMCNAGVLKVSKKISAAFSRFRRGFSGASVSNTGCFQAKKIAIF